MKILHNHLIYLLNRINQTVQFSVEFWIFVVHFFYFPDAVDDCGVVFSTEFFTDFRKRGFGQSF